MVTNKKYWIPLLVSVTLLMTKPSFSADLLQAYHDAVACDPTYKQAIAARLSAREALPQSEAALLPVISGNITTLATRSRFKSIVSAQEANYGTDTYSLTITQPIFNFASWMTVRQASAQVKQADANFGAAAQDLMLRVTQAYVNVLQAQDRLRITQAQKKLLARQLDQATQRYEVGLSAITNVYNAQAAHDLATAQEIIDKNTVSNQFESLRAITNHLYPSLAPLKKKIPLVTPVPVSIEKWVQAAVQQNLQLKAFRYAADAAREGIKVKAGGHMPTLNAIGGYSRSYGGPPSKDFTRGVSAIPNESSTAGLTLNVPISQGGLVSSQIRQAQYDFQQATAAMDFTYQSVLTQTRQTYTGVIANISSIKADQATIKSNQSALESNEAAYQAGTITIVDVLNAQSKLFDAERQYSADQYIYLINTLRLKQLAGTLSDQDLRIINRWLQTNNNAKR